MRRHKPDFDQEKENEYIFTRLIFMTFYYTFVFLDAQVLMIKYISLTNKIISVLLVSTCVNL